MKYAIAYTDFVGDRKFVEGDTRLECVIQIGSIEMIDREEGHARLTFKLKGYKPPVSVRYSMSEDGGSEKFSTDEAYDDFAKMVCDNLELNHSGVLYKNTKDWG